MTAPKRILVTGAAGFIGCHVAEAIAALDHNVVGIDDYSGGNNAPAGVMMIDHDLATHMTTKERAAFYADIAPEVLVHCAANAREGESFYSPAKIARANVGAYANCLTGCISAGRLKHVLMFSSMAAYGASHDPPFSEFTPLAPVDPYGESKRWMESITKMLASVHGYTWVIAVPHNVFGERQRLQDRFRNFVALCCSRIRRNEPIKIYGDGNQTRAFSYIGDSLNCYVRAALGEGIGMRFNIGGTVPVTINQLADAVCEDFGVPDWPCEHLPDRVGEVKHAWSTCEMSRVILGFEEKIGWREGVRRMVAWVKTQPVPVFNDDEKVELPAGRGLPETWK